MSYRNHRDKESDFDFKRPESDLHSFFKQLNQEELKKTSAPASTPNLYSLFSEIGALRSEIKWQGQHFKGALDDFKQVLNRSEAECSRLQKELDTEKSEQANIQALAQKPLLMSLIDFHDRVSLSLQNLLDYCPFPEKQNWVSKAIIRIFAKEVLENANKAQNAVRLAAAAETLILRRIERALNYYQVIAIPTVGHIFNPKTMNAREMSFDRNVYLDLVIGEIRRGYLWKGEILRLAEVKVNRREASRL